MLLCVLVRCNIGAQYAHLLLLSFAQGIIFGGSHSTLRSIIAFFANNSKNYVTFFVNQCVLCSFTKLKEIRYLRNDYDTLNLMTTILFLCKLYLLWASTQRSFVTS